MIFETDRGKKMFGGKGFEGRLAAKQAWEMEELVWSMVHVPAASKLNH